MSDQDLDILNPPEKKVQFQGREVVISPVRMGKLQPFTVAIKPVAQDIFLALTGSGDLLTTIELHGDRMILAVSIGSGIKIDEINEALPDEFLRLATAVVEVNADFFVRKLLPEVRAAVETMGQIVKSAKAGSESFKA